MTLENEFFEVVHTLKNGVHSRAEFISVIDNFQKHLKFTTDRVKDLEDQNKLLRKCVSMPPISFASTMEEREDYMTAAMNIFIWRLDPITVSHHVQPVETDNEAFWKLVRISSYRQVIKLVRKLFEENFIRFCEIQTLNRRKRRT